MSDAHQCVITPNTRSYELRSMTWKVVFGNPHVIDKEEQAARNWQRCRLAGNRRRERYWLRQLRRWHGKRTSHHVFINFNADDTVMVDGMPLWP